MLYSILVFVLVLSVLVLVHELGHFLTARKVGIAVEEFGFGFPPRAWGIKRGRTLYSLNWIPLGGFVRIKGELGEHAGDRDSYASKSRWQKAAVLVAGVVMNFLLAWALLTVGYLAGLPQVVDETPVGARVASPQIIIASVLPKTPAAESGLEAGDVIRSVGERPVSEIEAFREYTASHADQAVLLTVERGGDLKQIAVVPVLLTETGRPGIGVSLMKTGLVSYPWYWAPVQGAAATWSFTSDILSAFGSLLRDLIWRRPVSVDLSGPVGIAVVTSEVAKLGWRHVLQFTALLSVNLAIVNVLPFPALDGGRLMFLLFEAIRRRPVNRFVEAWAHNIGFAVLILIVVVVTYRDVLRFGGSFFKSVGSLFGL